jgi:CubicO group peptidase (beta-lactamase class C family)
VAGQTGFVQFVLEAWAVVQQDGRSHGDPFDFENLCMKRQRPAFLLLAALFLSRSLAATGAAEAGSVSAGEVLRKAIEARGGREAALNIHSFQAGGVVLFHTESVPYGPTITNAWPMEISAMRPDKFRFAADFNTTPDASFVFLPPRYFANGFNGRTAWEAPPGRRPQALDGIFLEERREQAELFAWCADPEDYQSLTNLGESPFEGQRCYELRLVRKSGNIETHYYNAGNCLLAGIVRSSVFGPSLERFVFSDYRKFGGFQFPTRISYRAEDERDTAHLHSDEQLTSIEVNQVKSPVFEMPRKTIPPPRQKEPRPGAISDAGIKTMLRDWIDNDKVADAIVVGLLDEQGRRVISRGEMDGTNVNGDTVFDIASITKVFTRLLLLDMVQRGEMKLDDPVQKYLPASVKMPTRGSKQITLLHLATHTSGLPRNWDGGCLPENLYSFLSSYKLPRDPGAEYEYSNLGACLLGQVIELKAGKPYKELLAERICRPLGMNHTYVDPQALACGVPPGAGRVLSSANDLLKLASACLGFTPSPLSPLLRHEYATHGGGDSSYLILDPVRRRAVVSLARSENGNYFVVRFALNCLILNQSSRPPDTASLDYIICERYVGQYLSDNNSTWTVRREGNRLLVQKPWAPSCEVFPQSETTFLSRMRGLGATFVPETPGRATQLLLRDLASDWSFRGAKISSHAPVPGVAFKLDPNTAEDYTGQYHDRNGHVLILRRQGGQFIVQTGEENSMDMERVIPGSETLFFSPAGPMAVTFLRDSSGKIAGLILHFYEEHIRYAKFAPAPALAGVAEADADRFIGVWEGTLVIQQTKIQVVIKISKVKGSCQASLDVPGEGVKDKPFKTLIFPSQSSLFLACPSDEGRITFRATLNNAATEMSGTWKKQGQDSLPVTLKRNTRADSEAGKIK